MPELPEVESLRRSLVPYVVGQKITNVVVKKPKLVSASGTVRVESQDKVAEFVRELNGELITGIKRIAKNLIFEFESGKVMLVHLKMTGQLVYQANPTNNQSAVTILGGHPIELSENTLPNKHSHVIFTLQAGTLFFNDTRMFGYLLYYPSWTSLLADKHFEKLGVDPFEEDFTLDFFRQQMKAKKANLKSVFLNQEVVVGLGNIYADEVCFAAGVRPTRTCDSLSKTECLRLYEAIKSILPLAIDMGGSSVANYLLGDGSKGNYANLHKVYKRGGKPCVICGEKLVQAKVAGRTTVYCKNDQK